MHTLSRFFDSIGPVNPNARTVRAESAPAGTMYTIRDDDDGVRFASGDASACVRFMERSKLSLRCFTIDGAPVSLLNVEG